MLFLVELRDLKFSKCREITSFWEEDGFVLENLIRNGQLGCNLKSLELSDCDKLERLPNG